MVHLIREQDSLDLHLRPSVLPPPPSNSWQGKTDREIDDRVDKTPRYIPIQWCLQQQGLYQCKINRIDQQRVIDWDFVPVLLTWFIAHLPHGHFSVSPGLKNYTQCWCDILHFNAAIMCCCFLSAWSMCLSVLWRWVFVFGDMFGGQGKARDILADLGYSRPRWMALLELISFNWSWKYRKRIKSNAIYSSRVTLLHFGMSSNIHLSPKALRKHFSFGSLWHHPEWSILSFWWILLWCLRTVWVTDSSCFDLWQQHLAGFKIRTVAPLLFRPCCI